MKVCSSRWGGVVIACFLGCSQPPTDANPAPSADLAAPADLVTGPTVDFASPPLDFKPPTVLPANDEFDGNILSFWQFPFPFTIGAQSVAGGRLSLRPLPALHASWYSDDRGAVVTRDITGDFVAEIDVQVGRADDITQPPRGQFSAGGFLLRDPRSRTPGGESWIMYNLGFQTTVPAREVKTTRPGMIPSLSTLYLMPSGGVLRGRLRVCRLGDTFRFYHQLSNEAALIEEAYGNGTTPLGNGAAAPTPGVVPGGVIRFVRPDLPATLQFGLMAGNYEAPYETEARFDYVRFAAASAPDDCVRPLP